MVLIDDELLGYSRRSAVLEMPVCMDGSGAFRGRFGTRPAAHAAGKIALWIPTRYPDRYALRCDSPEVAHLGARWAGRTAHVLGLEWDVETSSNQLEVHALIRVEGRSRWDDEPQRDAAVPTRNQLLLCTDPQRLAVFGSDGLAGDWVEIRFLFHYRAGAFNGDTWKMTPRLLGWRLHYYAATEVLFRESVR
jgi:hypothetical protein